MEKISFKDLMSGNFQFMSDAEEPDFCVCGRQIQPAKEDMTEGVEYCDGSWISHKVTDQKRRAGGSEYVARGTFVYVKGPCPSTVRIQPLKQQFFDNFDRNRQPQAYDFCREWIPAAPSLRLILSGEPGIGKTHLAHAMYFEFLGKRKNCTWMESTELADLFRDSQGYNQHDAAWYEATQKREKLFSDYCVFIDDLGSERNTKSEIFAEQFQILLNKMQGGLVITTNMKEADLREEYGEKICSRLFEYCKAFAMLGSDYRGSSLLKQLSRPVENLLKTESSEEEV